MNVQEYADYVIDNIAKVSPWKTLNITNKVLENYDVNEFITALYNSANRIDNLLSRYKVVVALGEARKQANNTLYKPNLQMTIDKLILDIHRSMTL